MPLCRWQILIALSLYLAIIESLGCNIDVGDLQINGWDEIDARNSRDDL